MVDLETSRAIADFVQATGASVSVNSGYAAMISGTARDGAFMTTLGEAMTRNVSLLVIGDAQTHWPRIELKLARAETIAQWPHDDELLARVTALRGCLNDQSHLISAVPDGIREIADRIVAAEYLVVLVAPCLSDTPQTATLWSTLLGLVRERNRVARAAILSFDLSMTLRSVLASRLDPPPLDFPVRRSALRIHFAPFGEAASATSSRRIVIGIGDGVFDQNERCLPASVPGLHHPGVVIRGDGSVTLPLGHCVNAPVLPTPAQRLKQLLAGISA